MRLKTGMKAGQGLGDSVADVTKLTGLDKVADTYSRLTGRDCGCEERREKLNNLAFLK